MSRTTLIIYLLAMLLIITLFIVLFQGVIILLSIVSRKNKTVLTEHVLTLGEEGFIEETIYNKTEQKWISVQKLLRTGNYVIIYIAQNSAHVIPRRAFDNAAEFEAFYQFCRSKIRGAGEVGAV